MLNNQATDDNLAQLKLAQLRADHFSRLQPGSTVVFSSRRAVWKVAKVVDRGAILYRADDGSHQHLAEWQELVLAIIQSH